MRSIDMKKIIYAVLCLVIFNGCSSFVNVFGSEASIRKMLLKETPLWISISEVEKVILEKGYEIA
jgi:hypothetical protein